MQILEILYRADNYEGSKKKKCLCTLSSRSLDTSSELLHMCNTKAQMTVCAELYEMNNQTNCLKALAVPPFYVLSIPIDLCLFMISKHQVQLSGYIINDTFEKELGSRYLN